MQEEAARERKRQRDGEAAPSTAAAAAAAGEAQYVYLPIADALKVPGARVCLFAAVSEIGAAVRSRGTGELPSPLTSSAHLPCARSPRVLGFGAARLCTAWVLWG